jgi:3-oxoacyl-[acyl-carrier protein] reductase
MPDSKLSGIDGLAGKLALVTGGTGAIGSAVCRFLADDGLRVAVVDLNASLCEDLARALSGGPHIGVAMNVADPEAVKQGYAEIVSRLGEVDVLVNVAGILSNKKLAATTPDEWRQIHAVNLDGPFFLSQAVVPHMRQKQWGRIVNIISYAWKSGGMTSGTAYSSSKAGLVGLTFTVARETAADGITCNGIAPAYVMSKMVTDQLTEEQRIDRLSAIPVRRFCQPEEIAHAVRFLVSPLAAFVTGEIVDLNGGFQFD